MLRSLPALARRRASAHARSLAAAALIGATAGACLAGPAGAATTRSVQVTDNAFVTPAVAIAPGDTVAWAYPAGGDKHNVHFDDGSFVMPQVPTPAYWMETRTFDTTGTFRYHCDEHGEFGGRGMSGTVYVNATATVLGLAPNATFTPSSPAVAVNQQVAFNAAASTDPDGTITRYEWDMDNDGTYETDTGASQAVARSFPTTGTKTIALRITDSQSLTSTTTRTIEVSTLPAAAFSVAPNPAVTGQTVVFDGSPSTDDGTIARYEWDLDGDGSYETDGGASPTTSRSYATPATLTIGLRLTDNLGLKGTATQVLRIDAPPPPPPPPVVPPPPAVTPPPPPPPAVSCARLKGAARTSCEQKACAKLKGTKRASCISRSCKYVTGSKRASCIQTSCKYVSKSKRASCGRASCRYLKGSKKRACQRKYAAKRSTR